MYVINKNVLILEDTLQSFPEIDVIPFTILPMEMAMYWGYQPRTIRRFGIYQTDGSVKWSNFYEADGSESILQIEMTKFTYR